MLRMTTITNHRESATALLKSDGRANRLLLKVMAGLTCLAILGCNGSGPSKAIVDAGRFFQMGKNQEALDALKDEESAEGSYLKAVALTRLKLSDTAREQILKAIELDEENAKY